MKHALASNGLSEDMPKVRVNEQIELAYESFGEGEPLILIMGLGAQMIIWEDEFCHALAERGFRVIRFDNRDVGHSTRLNQLPTPEILQELRNRYLGRKVNAPYTLEDMANDTLGLMDALGLESAHVVGLSLGGMIAQCMALLKPERVRSLCIMMSGPGELWAAIPTLTALRTLLNRPTSTAREVIVEHFANSLTLLGASPHRTPDARLRELAALSYERGLTGRGFARQFAAIVAAPPRTRKLRALRVPTLIIHGARDPLIPPLSGRLMAAQIPGARLTLIEGLGHDLGPSAWSYAISAISDNARRKLPRKPKRLGYWRAFRQRPIRI